MSIPQIRGWLLEFICRYLLEISGYTLLKEKKDKVVYEGSNNQVVMYGRGTHHQIDLPYEFKYFVPFTNPIQVIGEVKYHVRPIYKQYIREFIGVLNDIETNYVVSHLKDLSTLDERKLTQGIFISANKFNVEAEKLAYAHNIRLITFDGNPLLGPLLNLIDTKSPEIKEELKTVTRNDVLKYKNKILDEYKKSVKSQFLATTANGELLYFMSEKEFNFEDKDNIIEGKVFFNEDDDNNLIVLEIKNNSFISTVPSLLFDRINKQLTKDINENVTLSMSPLTIYILNNRKRLEIYNIIVKV